MVTGNRKRNRNKHRYSHAICIANYIRCTVFTSSNQYRHRSYSQKIMLNYSFFRYGIVGILSVIVDFLVLFICFNTIHFGQNISISIAFIISTIFNFILHRNFTFKKKNNLERQLIKYSLLISLSYFITILSIHYLVIIGLGLYLSKLLAVCFVYLYGYIFNRFFVFKGM